MIMGLKIKIHIAKSQRFDSLGSSGDGGSGSNDARVDGWPRKKNTIKIIANRTFGSSGSLAA